MKNEPNQMLCDLYEPERYRERSMKLLTERHHHHLNRTDSDEVRSNQFVIARHFHAPSPSQHHKTKNFVYIHCRWGQYPFL
jgi:hypothetical protein